MTPDGREPLNFGLISTFCDLELERKEVKAVLQGQRKIVRDLQDGARSETSEEVCAKEVSRYDAAIIILAHWYGSRVPGRGVSFTEMEITECLRQNIPVLAYTICPYKGKKAEIHYEFATREERLRLLEKVQRFVKTGTFESVAALGRSVLADLSGLHDDYRRRLDEKQRLKHFVLNGRLGHAAEREAFSAVIEPRSPIERAPWPVAEAVKIANLQRAFCVVNGMEDCKLWVYFSDEQRRAIDWVIRAITKVTCFPMQDGERKGLVVVDVLTPVVGPALLRVVK